jgi:hypothetical protein
MLLFLFPMQKIQTAQAERLADHPMLQCPFDSQLLQIYDRQSIVSGAIRTVEIPEAEIRVNHPW